MESSAPKDEAIGLVLEKHVTFAARESVDHLSGQQDSALSLARPTNHGNSFEKESTHIQQLGRVDPVVVSPPGDHMTSDDNLYDDAALVLPQRAREGWFGRRRRASCNSGTSDNSGWRRRSIHAETALRQGSKVRTAARRTCVRRIRYRAAFSTGKTLRCL
jgi:hypothetical protein